MISVNRALRAAHSVAVRYAPTEVTVYRIVYANDEDARATGFQGTVTTHRVRGTFAPQTTDHEPRENDGSVGGVVTLNLNTLGFTPTVADRIAVGGIVFNITTVHEIEAAIVKCIVRGPAPDPTESGDVTPPVITVGTITGGSGSITFGATIDEAASWRVRYRTPVETGTWNTQSVWSGATTVVSGTLAGLDAGTYRVEIQAKDSDDNVSDFVTLGDATVT